MDSLKISALLKAVELGSLTKAAEELGYTQAGLTHMMNRLETEIGMPLLNRSKNGVVLTDDAQRLLPYLRDFVISAQRLERTVTEITEGRKEIIRIGTFRSLLKNWLPEIILGFKKENPDVIIEIRDTSIENIYKWVSESEADVGFCSKLPGHEECGFIHLCDDPFYAVLPKSLDDGSETYDLQKFAGADFLMPTYGYDRDVFSILNQNGVAPSINPISISDDSIGSLVQMGLGVSILSELVLQTFDTSGIVTKKLMPECSRDLGIVVSNSKSKNPLVRKFIAFSELYIKKMYG